MWRDNLVDLQLVNRQYELAAKTLVSPGLDDTKRIYLADCHDNVIALVNQGYNEISINGTHIAPVKENSILNNEINQNLEAMSESDSYTKSELDAFFKIMTEKEKRTWDDGNIIEATATILAFFGFASVIAIQYKGNNKKDQTSFLSYVDVILVAIFAIQIIQLITILLIVVFELYAMVFGILVVCTIICLFLILVTTRKIIKIKHKGDIKGSQGDTMITEIEDSLSKKMYENAKKVNQELAELKKELESKKNKS
jgi:hypothetical protein